MSVNLQSLEGAELLRDLSPPQLSELGEIAREFSFEPNEYLFRLGDEARTLYVIVSGSVQLVIPLTLLGAKKEVPTAELGAGATLVWSAMVEPHRLTMSGWAKERTELVGWARSDLEDLLSANRDIGYQVMTNLSRVIGRRLAATKALWLRELQHVVDERYR